MKHELIKAGHAFPFPQFIEGRRVTTELYVNVYGINIYRMVVWMTQDEVDSWCDRPYPGGAFIHEIVETDNIWDLREMAQWSEKKHRAHSLCY